MYKQTIFATWDPKYQQKSKSISPLGQNYFAGFAMRYPIHRKIVLCTVNSKKICIPSVAAKPTRQRISTRPLIFRVRTDLIQAQLLYPCKQKGNRWDS